MALLSEFVFLYFCYMLICYFCISVIFILYFFSDSLESMRQLGQTGPPAGTAEREKLANVFLPLFSIFFSSLSLSDEREPESKCFPNICYFVFFIFLCLLPCLSEARLHFYCEWHCIDVDHESHQLSPKVFAIFIILSIFVKFGKDEDARLRLLLMLAIYLTNPSQHARKKAFSPV